MPLTITEIQARFPHVRAANRKPIGELGDYCVGGALCLSTERPWYFPDTSQLTLVLCDLNPSLTRRQAWWYATRIIGANDRADFRGAWNLADRALTRQGGAAHDGDHAA